MFPNSQILVARVLGSPSARFCRSRHSLAHHTRGGTEERGGGDSTDVTDVHHEICIGYGPDEPPTLAQISRDVVEHLIYGRLCLKRAARTELHRNHVKRARECLGLEGRGDLDGVVIGVELGEPLGSLGLDSGLRISLRYLWKCVRNQGRNGERESLTNTDLVPYPRFCPFFLGLRPYHSRCTALAPEMPRARTAGQCPSF